MLEYAEVFEGTGSAPLHQMYRLIGGDGDILTLRSDMTPPVARISATHFTPADAPLRFYYTENAFRCHESYKGRAGEFSESGVELIGATGIEADAEVIALAVNSLLLAGLKDFRFCISHVDFLKGAMEESGLPNAEKTLALEYLAAHNIVAAESIIKGASLPLGVRPLFERMNLLTGGLEMIDEVEAYVSNRASVLALQMLRELYDVISDYGLSDYILFDLGMTGTLDYYTGVVFRGYARGTGFSLLDGGRYDNLVKQYGQDLPAVGFALKLDNLATILNGNTKPTSDVLIAYTKDGREAALKKAAYLRADGVRVENCLVVGEPREFYVAEAKKRGISQLMYFEGGDNQ
jgi:ATP phosphoribosyltransferase regulatory subunit